MSVARTINHLSKICLALPEAAREDCNGHSTFSVRKRTFAYFLNNHHGDGIVAVTCKVLPGENAQLAASQPARFYLPAYIASRGWVGLRLDTPEIDWEEVGELVAGSYRMIAPKRLGAWQYQCSDFCLSGENRGHRQSQIKGK